MGKGDKKSRKGKITMGSHGVLRPKKKSVSKLASTKKSEPAKQEVAPKKVAAPKKAVAPKKAAKKAE